MKTIHYSNIRDNRGNRKTFVVSVELFDKIILRCTGRFGFGGESQESFYVDVTEWDKCLEVVNDAIKYGDYVYVKKDTPFNIK